MTQDKENMNTINISKTTISDTTKVPEEGSRLKALSLKIAVNNPVNQTITEKRPIPLAPLRNPKRTIDTSLSQRDKTF